MARDGMRRRASCAPVWPQRQARSRLSKGYFKTHREKLVDYGPYKVVASTRVNSAARESDQPIPSWLGKHLIELTSA